MQDLVNNISAHFKGVFVTEPLQLQQRLSRIKAFVFDWDGVFNSGEKTDGSSSFNEVDSMGTNLLRFNHYLHTGKIPPTIVISGENNKVAATLATRERYQAVYSGIKFKTEALIHLCEAYNIQPEEVAFVFDDVLDFSLAEKAGVRIMVSRECNPLLIDYAVQNNMVDYLTYSKGGDGALREATELMIGLGGKYNEVIEHRTQFTEVYRKYLAARNENNPLYYTSKDSKIIEHSLV